MTAPRFAITSLAMACLCLAIANRADAAHDFAASAEFFTNAQVTTIRIEVSAANLNSLRQNSRNYIRATVREGDKTYNDVAVHLKGAAGSFRGVDDLQGPALTLNFDKFNEHQKFHGMDKLHLNNSVQDPSYMTEIICGELFRAAGVPATRGTHARVFLNGRDLGLYVLKQGFDKEFLREYFVNTRGNLYDGGFLREINEPLQRTSGNDVKDYSDLKALFAAAQEPDPLKRMERLEQVLDLDRFISFIALEIMTCHWDGYALKRNNYRLYHDLSAGKMVFFPHGMDQMFWDASQPLLPAMAGFVANAVVTTEEGKRRYLERAGVLFTNLFKVETLTNRISELQQGIRPVLLAINPSKAREHDAAAQDLRNKIVARVNFLRRTLSIPAPVPLNFGSNGVVHLTDWRVQNSKGIAQVEKIKEATRTLLLINTLGDTNCVASWRSRVLLRPGEYRFQAMARTAGVIPIKDKKGQGAGIRISQFSKARANQLSGNADWTQLEFDFPVPAGGTGEIELLCELRASKGEVWFDLNSLSLIKR